VRTRCPPRSRPIPSLFGWLVADGWCWFVLREKYCWLVAGGWFVLREKYCWLVADKPSEQAVHLRIHLLRLQGSIFRFFFSLSFVCGFEINIFNLICYSRFAFHVHRIHLCYLPISSHEGPSICRCSLLEIGICREPETLGTVYKTVGKGFADGRTRHRAHGEFFLGHGSLSSTRA
jgi:hypothetical protein